MATRQIGDSEVGRAWAADETTPDGVQSFTPTGDDGRAHVLTEWEMPWHVSLFVSDAWSIFIGLTLAFYWGFIVENFNAPFCPFDDSDCGDDYEYTVPLNHFQRTTVLVLAIAAGGTIFLNIMATANKGENWLRWSVAHILARVAQCGFNVVNVVYAFMHKDGKVPTSPYYGWSSGVLNDWIIKESGFSSLIMPFSNVLLLVATAALFLLALVRFIRERKSIAGGAYEVQMEPVATADIEEGGALTPLTPSFGAGRLWRASYVVATVVGTVSGLTMASLLMPFAGDWRAWFLGPLIVAMLVCHGVGMLLVYQDKFPVHVIFITGSCIVYWMAQYAAGEVLFLLKHGYSCSSHSSHHCMWLEICTWVCIVLAAVSTPLFVATVLPFLRKSPGEPREQGRA